MEAPACCCVKCKEPKQPDDYYWQSTLVQGEPVRSRDRTCKRCRAWEKRQRDRTRPTIVAADCVIARFLRLPAPR